MWVSLDIKTANSDPSSICEIGIGVFENDRLIQTFRNYFDPGTSFDPFYTDNIHGISEEMVEGNGPIEYSYDEIRELLVNKIVVHHSKLIRQGFLKALENYDLAIFPIFWLDLELVAGITWKEFSEEGCGLQELSSFLKIEIGYPDALSYAVAAGSIVIEACKKSGIGVSELLNSVKKYE